MPFPKKTYNFLLFNMWFLGFFFLKYFPACTSTWLQACFISTCNTTNWRVATKKKDKIQKNEEKRRKMLNAQHLNTFCLLVLIGFSTQTHEHNVYLAHRNLSQCGWGLQSCQQILLSFVVMLHCYTSVTPAAAITSSNRRQAWKSANVCCSHWDFSLFWKRQTVDSVSELQ